MTNNFNDLDDSTAMDELCNAVRREVDRIFGEGLDVMIIVTDPQTYNAQVGSSLGLTEIIEVLSSSLDHFSSQVEQ